MILSWPCARTIYSLQTGGDLQPDKPGMQYYVWHLFCRSNTLRYGSIDATCGYWGKWWKPQDVVVLEEKLSGFAAWRWVFFRAREIDALALGDEIINTDILS